MRILACLSCPKRRMQHTARRMSITAAGQTRRRLVRDWKTLLGWRGQNRRERAFIEIACARLAPCQVPLGRCGRCLQEAVGVLCNTLKAHLEVDVRSGG